MSTAFIVRPRAAGAVMSGGQAPGPQLPPPRRRVVRAAALTPLAAHLADPEVTDVFVNGDAGLFLDRGHGAEPVGGWRATEPEVRALAVDLIALGGRHLDDATPCVDVRLDDGLRVHAVLPPISRVGTLLSIRVPAAEPPSLCDLASRGMFDGATRQTLERLVARRVNLLITGAAGTGKTTLLAALLAEVPATERIVTIEDVAELSPAHPHHVRLEARQANLEGAGAIPLSRLVREALRMRPDRIVVGECRGEELRELLLALNTGHDGGAGTLHAGGLDEVPARLEALGALAGMDAVALARQVVGAIGCVIHLRRGADGRRAIDGFAQPTIVDGRIGMRELR